MAYEWITKYSSPNFGRDYTGQTGTNDPKYIVIHHWGEDSYTWDGTIATLCNGNRGDNRVSAHLVVEAGRVACLVDYANSAWHSGDSWYNSHSIGIECRPLCTAGDIATLEEVIADLYSTYGVLPLLGHKDIRPTACPGRYYARLAEIQVAATAIYQGAVKRQGWIKDNVGWYYVRPDGTYIKSEWEKLSGEWYYFNGQGYAVTGWHKIDGKWYYFNSDCKMLTGWQFLDYKWYYFELGGEMRTGWVKWRDRWYFLREENGDMVSDEFRKVDDDWYRFGSDGTMYEKTALYVGENGVIR